MQWNNSIRLLAVAALLTGGASAALAESRWGANYFPNVPLVNQDGKTVRFYDDLLKGKIVAVYLMYTTCKYSCPLETARLAQAQRLLGDRVGRDIFFYSITIDPKHDTPEVLKSYAERYHAGPGWQFLTGKQEDIELISKKLGLYSEPDPANSDGHIPILMIGNVPTGQWMKNSALDNPRFLATMIGQFLEGWKHGSTDPLKSYSGAPEFAVDRGQYLFGTKCAACHTIGRGDRVGPDLLGVTQSRDRAWLTRYIQTPDKVLAGGDPTAKALFSAYKEVRMPNLSLSEAEAKALIGFLDRKVLYFIDPMHPAYRSDKPGTAPDCGMRLEPVFADNKTATSGTRPASSVQPAVSRIPAPSRRTATGNSPSRSAYGPTSSPCRPAATSAA
jgi:protein SCO1